MASHLLVTANTTPGLPPKPANPAEPQLSDTFEALLGAAGPQTDANPEAAPGTLVNLSFGAGFGNGDQPPDNPDAIAAPIDAQIPFQTDLKPALGKLIEGLADLKASLAAGEPLDVEALKRLDAALQSLADTFDIDPTDLPSVDELAALASAELPEGATLDAQLNQALAPLAQSLIGGTATADAELSGLVKSIGDKLAALVQSLNAGGLDPERLAALGLDAAEPDADLEAAIARLVNAAPKVDATAAGQVLAAPTLKLTEPVLSGKAADAAPAIEAADTRETPEKPQAAVAPDTDRSEDAKSDTTPDRDGKTQADAKPAAAIAPAPDKLPDSQIATQTTQQTSRIDAAAAPRVIQAGYQTSQQQLNLPQLAFELVRQVNDGNTRFQMRLDPPELGRIDVKLDIDASGQVNARLTVEKAETLDLMQRDQRGLEKALQQAGLDGAKTNLEFSLKQNPGGNQQGQDGNGRQRLFGADTIAETEEAPLPTINLYRGSLTASGVNIIA